MSSTQEYGSGVVYPGSGGGGGGIASINADTTAAQTIVSGSGTRLSVVTSGGVTTITTKTVVAPGMMELANPKYVRAFVGNSINGNNDLYTAPSNRRAYINAVGGYNNTGSGINYYTYWTIGGTKYQIFTILSATANTQTQNATGQPIILEPGETIGMNTAATGMNLWCRVVEYDSTTPVYAVKKSGSWINGDNTIYTVPAATTAMLMDGTGAMNQNTTALNYFNGSGSSTNTYWNYVASGGSPGGTNKVMATTATASPGHTNLTLAITMAAGDFVSINTNSVTDPQLAWVLVTELT